MEVERDLEAHDTQDRDIPPGIKSTIYTYSGVFMNHGPRRSSCKVVLYKTKIGGDSDLDGEVGKAHRELPSDVDGNFTIGATGYSPPSQKVLYTLLCNCARGRNTSSRLKTLGNVLQQDNGFSGPIGNSEARCTVFVMGCKVNLSNNIDDLKCT